MVEADGPVRYVELSDFIALDATEAHAPSVAAGPDFDSLVADQTPSTICLIVGTGCALVAETAGVFQRSELGPVIEDRCSRVVRRMLFRGSFRPFVVAA